MIIWLLWLFWLHPLLSWKAICKHMMTTAEFGSSTGKQTFYNTTSNLLIAEEKYEWIFCFLRKTWKTSLSNLVWKLIMLTAFTQLCFACWYETYALHRQQARSTLAFVLLFSVLVLTWLELLEHVLLFGTTGFKVCSSAFSSAESKASSTCSPINPHRFYLASYFW